MSETDGGATSVESKQADIVISTVILLFGASNTADSKWNVIGISFMCQWRFETHEKYEQFPQHWSACVLCPGLWFTYHLTLCLHTLKSCRGYSSSPCGCRFTSSTILCYRCTSRSCRGASSIILTCRGTFKLQLYHHINLLLATTWNMQPSTIEPIVTNITNTPQSAICAHIHDLWRYVPAVGYGTSEVPVEKPVASYLLLTSSVAAVVLATLSGAREEPAASSWAA